LILILTLSLNFSTSYFQSSVLALASLWGSAEVLASMSGQGGVAVLISLAQVSLAIIGAMSDSTKTLSTSISSSGPGHGSSHGAGSSGEADGARPSTLAAVGLWALGSIGIGLCLFAFRYLRNHPTYSIITSHQGISDAGQSSDSGIRTSAIRNAGPIANATKKGSWNRTKRVLGKNKTLYIAVALDFAVTLVSSDETLPAYERFDGTKLTCRLCSLP
jgi:equilibrative nucleoside transporter 1/2/3